MAGAAQWLEAPDGSLCAREQAKAFALREMWLAEGKSTYGMLASERPSASVRSRLQISGLL